MDKVKIGVIGGGREKSMIRYGREASNAELVAICDFRDDVLERILITKLDRHRLLCYEE